ncbi:MAG: hypothetical protein HY770_04655 [Chitinivibrionia bacterium]|nr:hypothetical protein [Chitinivibrionia bacterium]
MKNEMDYRPDGRWQDLWIEIKFKTHGFRNLRAGLLEFAYWLASHPKDRGLLVLVDSRITEKRLQNEWQHAVQAIRPDVVNRLILAWGKDGQYKGLPQELGDDFRAWLNQLVSEELPRARSRESFHTILQILLHEWFLGKEPMTRTWLGRVAGCSYPTVAAALQRLEPYLLKHSDRRFELKDFPRKEWTSMLAVSDRVRGTVRFAVPSGESRSAEDHIERLERMRVKNVAIGGVLGARYYDSGLDLVGTPRLDLSLHSPGKQADLSFIKRLDPALHQIHNSLQPINVAIHIIRRTEAFFTPRLGGLPWADPIECLLDLHEANLQRQANDLLRALQALRSAAK